MLEGDRLLSYLNARLAVCLCYTSALAVFNSAERCGWRSYSSWGSHKEDSRTAYIWLDLISVQVTIVSQTVD